jgi:hypothetical protein
VIVERAYGLKSADSPWTRLILDLNRGKEVVRHTIGQLRELVAGFRDTSPELAPNIGRSKIRGSHP